MAEPQLGTTSAMPASRLGAPAELGVCVVGARGGQHLRPSLGRRRLATDSGALALDRSGTPTNRMPLTPAESGVEVGLPGSRIFLKCAEYPSYLLSRMLDIHVQGELNHH